MKATKSTTEGVPRTPKTKIRQRVKTSVQQPSSKIPSKISPRDLNAAPLTLQSLIGTKAGDDLQRYIFAHLIDTLKDQLLGYLEPWAQASNKNISEEQLRSAAEKSYNENFSKGNDTSMGDIAEDTFKTVFGRRDPSDSNVMYLHPSQGISFENIMTSLKTLQESNERSEDYKFVYGIYKNLNDWFDFEADPLNNRVKVKLRPNIDLVSLTQSRIQPALGMLNRLKGCLGADLCEMKVFLDDDLNIATAHLRPLRGAKNFSHKDIERITNAIQEYRNNTGAIIETSVNEQANCEKIDKKKVREDLVEIRLNATNSIAVERHTTTTEGRILVPALPFHEGIKYYNRLVQHAQQSLQRMGV